MDLLQHWLKIMKKTMKRQVDNIAILFSDVGLDLIGVLMTVGKVMKMIVRQ